MIDKTREAKRWGRAMRIARAKEVRAIKLRLYRELFGLYFSEFRVKLSLFVRRAIRKLFLCGKLCYHKIMILLMDGLLALNEFYNKLSWHRATPLVDATETPRQNGFVKGGGPSPATP